MKNEKKIMAEIVATTSLPVEGSPATTSARANYHPVLRAIQDKNNTSEQHPSGPELHDNGADNG